MPCVQWRHQFLLKFVDLTEHLDAEDPIAAALDARNSDYGRLAADTLHARATHPRTNERTGVLLLLDGLDEIATEKRAAMLLHILNLGEIDDTRYPRELVVMTTRFSIANTVDLAPLGFEALYLLPPSPKAAEGILGTTTNDVLVGADPLRLRMLGMVSKIDGKDAAVGMSRRRLYDRILEVLLNRCTAGALQSDSLRFTVCELGVLLLGRGLQKMAVAAHEALLVEMTASDVQRAFDDPRTAAAVWLLARAGQLPPLEPRGDSHIGFFHLTFQEHLAATGVGCGMFDEVHRLEDPWWQMVILSGLSLLRGDDEYGMALDAAAKLPGHLRSACSLTNYVTMVQKKAMQ